MKEIFRSAAGTVLTKVFHQRKVFSIQLFCRNSMKRVNPF